jgi:hypothetical protein
MSIIAQLNQIKSMQTVAAPARKTTPPDNQGKDSKGKGKDSKDSKDSKDNKGKDKPEKKVVFKPPKKGVSPRSLLSLGRRYWGRNSQWVKLTRPKSSAPKGSAPILSTVAYSTHDNFGIRKRPNQINRYTVTVTSKDKPDVPISKAKWVTVSCQCKSHKFGCEYKLWKMGGAELIYSNGRPPVSYMVNIPAVCKHVYKALLTIVQKGM